MSSGNPKLCAIREEDGVAARKPERISAVPRRRARQEAKRREASSIQAKKRASP